MEFLYLGKIPFQVRIPGTQYTHTIPVSGNPIRTNDKELYDYLLSDDNPEKHLFKETESDLYVGENEGAVDPPEGFKHSDGWEGVTKVVGKPSKPKIKESNDVSDLPSDPKGE